MKMKRFAAVAIAAAALGLPAAPAAFAHDPHDQYQREESLVVHFHLDGSREIHASSHDSADRDIAFLRSMGADASLVGEHSVRYHMHGKKSIRYSAREAYRLTDELRRFGFQVHIDRA